MESYSPKLRRYNLTFYHFERNFSDVKFGEFSYLNKFAEFPQKFFSIKFHVMMILMIQTKTLLDEACTIHGLKDSTHNCKFYAPEIKICGFVTYD